jgi:hypothetical protein
VEVTKFKWFGSGWYWLRCASDGMANNRSRMMTAAQKVLCERIKEISIKANAVGYYQMD